MASRTYVYVLASDSGELFTLQLDLATGELTLLDATRVRNPDTASGGASPMTLSPERRRLYVALRADPNLALSFAVDTGSGRLTKLGQAPLPHSMAYVSTDRSGRWLLCASYPGHLLSISPIDAEGVAGPPLHQIPTRPNAHAVLADPSNRFVFNSSLGGDVMQQHRFDAATGALTPNQPAEVAVRDGAGPRHFVFHPNGRLVYLLNELDASVYVFDFDGGSGVLSQRQTASARPPGFEAAPAAADLHLTPDARFLYASVRNSSTLTCFVVDAQSGELAANGYYRVPQQPRGFAIDPSGGWLLCAGQLSQNLGVFAIDARTGALVQQAEYPMGRGPNWVEITTYA